MSLAYRCASCGFTMGEPIARLAVSDLCFVSDRRFPGRCVVVLREHASELFQLAPALRHAFADDLSNAAQAIAQAVGALKINYEILGNVDPHVHCHLIPRRADEPKPKAPAWLHPDAQAELDAGKAAAIQQRIAARLGDASTVKDAP